jgi:hypothetical protein
MNNDDFGHDKEHRILNNILEAINTNHLTKTEYAYVQLQIALLDRSLNDRLSNVINFKRLK